MSSSCAQWRGDIGAYIVGALNGGARDEVTRHLAACAGCRADYDELVPVREWLGLLDLMTGAPQPESARRPAPAAHNSLQEGTVPTADALPPPSCREPGTRILAKPAAAPPACRPRKRRRLTAAGAALAAAAVRAREVGSDTGVTVLTPRELDVLKLVAQGLSNPDIARRLVLSEHTVHRHLANILRKLNLTSRAAAAAWAARAGLV